MMSRYVSLAHVHALQVQIYMERGLSEHLAREVARELTDKDVVRAHARDELGIDIDALANPFQVNGSGQGGGGGGAACQ
jgi:VIT1/CCC1 family predicted Fe2+/Mn2+ transporter